MNKITPTQYEKRIFELEFDNAMLKSKLKNLKDILKEKENEIENLKNKIKKD